MALFPAPQGPEKFEGDGANPSPFFVLLRNITVIQRA
jgi:hypothetical protein